MKTLLFLGQAPARPSSKHEVPGTYLYAWLRSIGLSDRVIERYCHFYALTDIFPGSSRHGHLAPSPEQIAAHRPALIQAITALQPDVVVPVGKMAITELLQEDVALIKTVGQKFEVSPFGALNHLTLCIPLSHPSGRSVWNNVHKDKVLQALALLRSEIDG